MVFENNLKDMNFLNPFGFVPFTLAENLGDFQNYLNTPDKLKLVSLGGFFDKAEKIFYEGHAIILINSRCTPEKTSEIPSKKLLEETLGAVGVKLGGSGSGVTLERKAEDGDIYHGTNALVDHIKKFGSSAVTLQDASATIHVSTTGKYGLSSIKQKELVGWGVFPAFIYDPKSNGMWLRDYQTVPFATEYKPKWPFDLRFRH